MELVRKSDHFIKKYTNRVWLLKYGFYGNATITSEFYTETNVFF